MAVILDTLNQAKLQLFTIHFRKFDYHGRIFWVHQTFFDIVMRTTRLDEFEVCNLLASYLDAQTTARSVQHSLFQNFLGSLDRTNLLDQEIIRLVKLADNQYQSPPVNQARLFALPAFTDELNLWKWLTTSSQLTDDQFSYLISLLIADYMKGDETGLLYASNLNLDTNGGGRNFFTFIHQHASRELGYKDRDKNLRAIQRVGYHEGVHGGHQMDFDRLIMTIFEGDEVNPLIEGWASYVSADHAYWLRNSSPCWLDFFDFPTGKNNSETRASIYYAGAKFYATLDYLIYQNDPTLTTDQRAIVIMTAVTRSALSAKLSYQPSTDELSPDDLIRNTMALTIISLNFDHPTMAKVYESQLYLSDPKFVKIGLEIPHESSMNQISEEHLFN